MRKTKDVEVTDNEAKKIQQCINEKAETRCWHCNSAQHSKEHIIWYCRVFEETRKELGVIGQDDSRRAD